MEKVGCILSYVYIWKRWDVRLCVRSCVIHFLKNRFLRLYQIVSIVIRSPKVIWERRRERIHKMLVVKEWSKWNFLNFFSFLFFLKQEKIYKKTSPKNMKFSEENCVYVTSFATDFHKKSYHRNDKCNILFLVWNIIIFGTMMST